MIKIIRYDEKPITLIGECVGNCYGSDTSDEKKNFKRGMNCIKSGHGRVEEYPDIIMEIDGYSIKVVRELYTHIIGVSRTQESTRYVNMKKRGYITPPSLNKNQEALNLYKQEIDKLFDTYNQLVALGIPKEDASMVLPLSLKTKLVLKINVRALLHMAHIRMCSRAYWEFRDLMKDIQKELSNLSDEWKIIADMMKPICEINGYCTEEYGCGRKPKKETEL